MKKTFTTLFMCVFVLAGFSQEALDATQHFRSDERKTIDNQERIHLAESRISSINQLEGQSRAGGSCILFEEFETGFPSTWFLSQTNQVETWQHTTTLGNPDGGMEINYDASLGQQNEAIVTPFLDLTQIPNPALSFDWSMSYFWGVDPNDNYDFNVGISIDGGQTFTILWSESDEGVFDSYTYATQTINLSAYSNATNALIAFQYVGQDGAALYLDNVGVCTQASNDMAVEKVIMGDPFNDYIYTSIPVGLTTEMVIGAVVANTGSAVQTGISVDLNLYSYNAGAFVSTGTLAGPAVLAPGQSDTIWATTGYTPSAVDTLEALVQVSANEVDGNSNNDIGVHGPVFISNERWGHDDITEPYIPVGFAANSTQGIDGYEMGCRFFAQADGATMYAAEIAMDDLTTAQTIIVKVYEGDHTATSPVSLAIYDIQPGDIPASGVEWFEVSLDDPVPFVSGEVYTVTIEILAGDEGYLFANDYGNNDASQVLYLGSDDDWYNWTGLVTSIRAMVSYPVEVSEESGLTELTIYPNPAENQVNVNIASIKDQEIIVNVFGLDGTLVLTNTLSAAAGLQQQLVLDVSNLAHGVYTVQTVTQESTLSKKIVIQ